jgi:hypothetical protein
MINKFKLYENEDIIKNINSERIPVKKDKDKSIEDKDESTEDKNDIVKESIILFNDFLIEGDGGGSAYATAGNTTGMGEITAPQPSSTPGDVAGSTIGSGDLPAYDLGSSFGPAMFNGNKKKKRKYSTKKVSKYNRHQGTNQPKETMYITSFEDWTNNGK